MRVAFLGCGYVADFYMATISYYSNIELVGVYDNNPLRLEQFCEFYSVQAYDSFDHLLSDKTIKLVLNLTNPGNHYKTTKRILLSGKHVYTEKPIALRYKEARELFELSKHFGLYFGSAPCSILSETAQTISKALKDNLIGPIRLINARFDAGMTHRLSANNWVSVSGAPWPIKDEFEVGCTYEHAGYFLTWLASFFGPAKSVSAYASIQVPDKGIKLDVKTPDFSAGCIEYANGIVANVTCSILAPLDRSLTIIGDKGTIYVRDIRDDTCPVYISATPPNKIINAVEYRLGFWTNKIENFLNFVPWAWGRDWRFRKRYKYAVPLKRRISAKFKPVDFCRGPSELIDAINNHKESIVSAEIGVHINEIIEVLQYPEKFGGLKKLQSSFTKNSKEISKLCVD